MQLVKNVVLGEDSGNEVLGKLKYGVDDPRKETFDTHNSYGRHLRSQWEHKSVLGLPLGEIFKERNFFALVGVRGFIAEIKRGIFWPLQEVFSHGIEEHEDHFSSTFSVLLGHLRVICEHSAGLEEAIQCEMERNYQQQCDSANLPDTMH